MASDETARAEPICPVQDFVRRLALAQTEMASEEAEEAPTEQTCAVQGVVRFGSVEVQGGPFFEPQGARITTEEDGSFHVRADSLEFPPFWAEAVLYPDGGRVERRRRLLGRGTMQVRCVPSSTQATARYASTPAMIPLCMPQSHCLHPCWMRSLALALELHTFAHTLSNPQPPPPWSCPLTSM